MTTDLTWVWAFSVKSIFWAMLSSWVPSEQDDQINKCTGCLDRIDRCSPMPRDSKVLHCLICHSYVGPFCTPANCNPPLQSQGEGCLLWLTTKLTKRASHSVNWPAHPGFCFALLHSVFPLGYYFYLPVQFHPFTAAVVRCLWEI